MLAPALTRVEYEMIDDNMKNNYTKVIYVYVSDEYRRHKRTAR